MKSKEFQKTEYHKIKNYLMMRIFHAGEESVPLPSSYELAKQFHVARATVTKAINILHDEGYIYSKKGIGIFSIPRNNGSPLKLVGFLTGRGKNFYHDYSSWFSVALVGLELTKENCMVKEIYFTGLESGERIEEEFRMQNFDALYYNGHPDDCAPLIRNLQKEGFPLVTFAGNDETRNYRIDYTATGYETGKTLAKEKRIHFYSKDLDPYSGFLIGLEKGYAEYKCPLICKTFRNMDDLNLLLEERIPDVLFITAANDCKILDLLEKKNIDYKKQCRLVSYSPKMLDTRFCGIHLTPPEQEISSNITKDLLEMLNGKKLEIGTTAFPLKTKEICKKQ